MLTRRIITVGVLLAGAVVHAGCTAITDDTSTQCRSQQDCWARGAEFANTTCSEQRVCVPLEVGAPACQHNTECIERAGGAPYICEKTEGRCVPVTTTDCPTLLGDKEDLTNDEVIIMGFMASATATAAQGEAALDLARSETKKTIGRFGPPSRVGGRPPPSVVLSCISEPTASGVGSAAAVNRVVDHWGNKLKVPFFIGPQSTPQQERVFSQTIPLNMAAMTQNSSASISDLADNDQVFRIGPSEPTLLGIVTPALNDFLVAKIRAEQTAAGVPADQPIKLALVTETGQTLVQVAGTLIEFNGAKATQQPDPNNFLVVDMGNTTDPVNSPNPETQTAKSLAQLVAFRPNVVVWLTAPTLAPRAWAPLMRAWPTGAGAPPRPYSLTTVPAWQDFIVPAVNSLAVPIREASRKHFLGMNGTSPTFDAADNKFQTFVDSLRLSKPEFSQTVVSTITGLYYDAFYMNLFARVALGAEAVTGRGVARGIRRVADISGGVPVHWGTNDLAAGIAALTAGKNLSFIGSTGDYRFDEKGDRIMNSELYCVSNVGGAGKLDIQRSGYVLDNATKTTSNTFSCD